MLTRRAARGIVRRFSTSLFLAWALAMVVTGCKVGPDYQTPKAAVPNSYTSLGTAALTNDTNNVPTDALTRCLTLQQTSLIRTQVL